MYLFLFYCIHLYFNSFILIIMWIVSAILTSKLMNIVLLYKITKYDITITYNIIVYHYCDENLQENTFFTQFISFSQIW